VRCTLQIYYLIIIAHVLDNSLQLANNFLEIQLRVTNGLMISKIGAFTLPPVFDGR